MKLKNNLIKLSIFSLVFLSVLAIINIKSYALTVEEVEEEYEITKSNVTIEYTKTKYNSKAKKPKVTVSFNNKELIKGQDYAVKYVNNTNTGEASVIVKGKGSYRGTITKKFVIVPSDLKGLKVKKQTSKTITLSWKKNEGNITGYIINQYNPTTQKYDIYVGSRYSTSYMVDNLKSGKTYKFKVRPYKQIGEKKYYGKEIKIKTTTRPAYPKMKDTVSGDRSFTVRWEKSNGASGYVVEYATESDFLNSKKVTVNSSTYKVKIKGIEPYQTYYIRVKAFKNFEGKRIYS